MKSPPNGLGMNKGQKGLLIYLLQSVAGMLIWWLVYQRLAMFAAWFTYSWLALKRDSHLGSAMEFFVYESPKVLLLLAQANS